MKNETAVLQAKNKILNENLLKSALWLSGCDKRDSESSASPLLRKTGAHGMFLTAGVFSNLPCRAGLLSGGVFSNLPNRAGLLSGGCSATSPPLQGAVVCGGGGCSNLPGTRHVSVRSNTDITTVSPRSPHRRPHYARARAKGPLLSATSECVRWT